MHQLEHVLLLAVDCAAECISEKHYYQPGFIVFQMHGREEAEDELLGGVG